MCNRSQQVKIKDSLSSSVKVKSGVPQGSVLGPILFLIFISYIGKDSPVRSFLYVDDSKLLKEVTGEEDIEKFHDEMEKFYRWTEINNMSLNGDKFVILRYGKDQDLKLKTTHFTENWTKTSKAQNHHKDLGFYMSNTGKFDYYLDELCKKVRKRIGWVCRTFYSRHIEFMRRI